VSDGPERSSRRALFERLRGRAPEGGHWVKVHRPAMACRFEVTLAPEDARHVEAARAALDEVDAIEAVLSWFRDTSELTRVNREAAAGPVVVGPFLFALLGLCRELHALTGGAFDPASTALSRSWGFLDRRPQLPTEEAIADARARSGMDKVVLDGSARSVRFSIPGVELNFGAVGKGWALDRVAASLVERGVSRALVSAGGSSQRAWGALDWELALEPGRREIARLFLRDAALATSAAGEQHFEAAGRRYGHVLDPRTGRPAEGVRSASVVASEAAVADALSTAFLVAGPALAEAVCQARPGTQALMVLDGRPDEILVVGTRDGVSLEPLPGVRIARRAARG
jgi:thiamine biosynthesis lipoprotein